MIINNEEFYKRGITYTIRSAVHADAKQLAQLRLQIDGETENLDREPGEALMNEHDFEQLIKNDSESDNNLFLVAVIQGQMVGFSRCQGNKLKRLSHKVEFGVGVLKDYWGYGIGKKLLSKSIIWADSNNLKKMTLHVLETNKKAVTLYKSLGFEIEGVLKKDKRLSDGNYYHTIVMGRIYE
ncbi:GNAT family N-acetyltransferase [Metabacillus iocasae]|uniref:Ribosomal protein S18 acetylase RimI-like enzyme n=1 Tax=Priestia iocasae TaxID=2291674 RepID=A0ABS2QWM0_9BACI|nr:GNAT family N-acetyltransferase [Metabacillus iocasae]MBM7703890.1 ribosomal protein S18 acetylase RimI-like enzyme [Metabacillus iocasae]